ncbi:MAG: thiamine pyrophosphate-binding protein [Thalassobaculales bacterium]
MRSGGRILVDALVGHGVDMAFGVPGESYLAVLDALYDTGIRFVICRQEGGAAMMAEAYGKLTGRPGICMVTRGPGATNASAGVHVAFQDATPLILFIGQVGNDMVEREAFQEIDYRRMFGPMAKWVAQIDDPARVPEYLSRAFHVATSGRPGPVVLALPEDMLTGSADVADLPGWQRARAFPDPAAMAALGQRLAAAERPFVLVGGGGWSAAAAADLAEFAAAWALPVGAAFRCQDYLDNLHPAYAGHVGIGIDPKLKARIQEADLLLVIGARLDEMTTAGYTLLAPPRAGPPLVHVFPDPEELNRVYRADLAIPASIDGFLAAARGLTPPATPPWAARTAAAHADYLAFSTPLASNRALDLGAVVAHLRQEMPADTIVANGAGNYAVWVHRFWRYAGWRTELAPTSGSMGYGTPAAVAAALLHPDRPVLCFAGDGCFQMTCQELATARQFGARPIWIVVNNGTYGTIRMHQEREYPGRVSGTDLFNPDFAALARAYGFAGETVERTADFAAALARVRAAGTGGLIELRTDPEQITPVATISGLREAASKRHNAVTSAG